MNCKILVDKNFSISKEDWNFLFNQDVEATIFQSYNWNKSFYYSLCQDLNLHNLCFYIESKCIAIFPLVEREFDNCTILEFIGSRMVDYLSPIILEEYKDFVYKTFKRYIIKNKYLFYGYDVKNTHSLLNVFKQHCKTVDTCYFKQSDQIPHSTHKEYDYDNRYLSKHFNMSIIEKNKPSDLYIHINLYLENMNILKKHKIDNELRQFWAKYIDLNITNLQSINLIINNENAYSVLYEIKGQVIYLLNYAFNTKYKQFAPGKILLFYVINKYSKDYTIDFSRGEDLYKIRLGCRKNYNVKFLFPRNLKVLDYLNKIDAIIGFFPKKTKNLFRINGDDYV